MALIKCSECEAQISDKATSCPSCGAPVAKKKKSKAGKIVLWTIVLIVAIGWLGPKSETDTPTSTADSKTAKASAEPAPKPEKIEAKAGCEKGDLQCWGEKNVVAAGVRCKRPIERFAKYDFKWTDGFLEPKMSHYRWSDIDANIVTYIGDKVQFQNGFGAFITMIYECDMSPDGETVLDVRIREGRLPR